MRNVLLVLLFALGCGGKEADFEMRVRGLEADLVAAQAEVASAQSTIEDLKGDVSDLLEEKHRLTDRLETVTFANSDQRVTKLERDLAAARDEAARYREGLEKAVEALNQQAQKHQLDQYVAGLEKRQTRRTSRRSGRKSSSKKKEACCVRASKPYMSHVDRSVIVTGEVKNSRPSDASGSVLVELFDGNDLIDSRTVRLTIPAGLENSYEVAFSVPSNGKYRVRSTWADF